jgi:hypothetical protein
VPGRTWPAAAAAGAPRSLVTVSGGKRGRELGLADTMLEGENGLLN